MSRLMILVLVGLAQVAAVTESRAGPDKRVEADMGPGCRFAAQIPEGKQNGIFVAHQPPRGGLNVEPLPKSWKSSLGDLYFDLSCYPSDDASATGGLAKLNDKTGQWEKDLDGALAPPPPTPEERKILDAATRVLNIQAVNSKGYASLIEDTVGDEERRQRRMFFCLFQPPKAICGNGEVGILREGRKGDLTPHSLKIIQSIEFLPDEPQAHSKEPTSEPKSDVKP